MSGNTDSNLVYKSDGLKTVNQKPTIIIKKNPAKVTEVSEVSEEVWSIECTIDELFFDLCRTKQVVVIERGFRVNGKESTKAFIIHKYYRQARELMKWIPIAKPVPQFIINASDLSPKVIEELEVRIDDSHNLHNFEYMLKQAVGRIFENLDFNYYHQNIARHLKVRMES